MVESVILVDPEIQGGVPVFAGTRVPVATLFTYLEEGDSLRTFLDDFPSVPKEACVAALEEARRALALDGRSA